MESPGSAHDVHYDRPPGEPDPLTFDVQVVDLDDDLDAGRRTPMRRMATGYRDRADLHVERDRIRLAGWPIEEDIMRRPWGLQDFRVLDPDGYYLRFTSRAR